MTTLVGINESGKSNILRALSLINDDVPLSKDDLRDPGHNEDPPTSAYINFVFNIEEYMYSDIYDYLDKKIVDRNSADWIVERDKTRYTINEFIKQYRKQFIYVVNLISNKKYIAVYAIESKELSISSSWKKIKKSVNYEIELKGKIVTLSEGTLIPNEIVDKIKPINFDDIDAASFLGVINKSITETLKEYIPNCIHWKYTEENLLPEKINKASFAQNPKSCIPLKNMFLLAGYRDVTKIIQDAETKTNGISNLLRKVSENSTTHMRDVWPEWENLKIVVRENGAFFEAGIEDKYNIFSVSRRSDGFKRFFTFLLMISVQNKSNDISDNIIIVDEPEIGLHPSGVVFLRNELEKISENNIVMVATHSIFMVDNKIIDRHLIVEKKDEITKVTRVESSNINDEEVIFKALGYSVFDLLRPINIIFEGWKDKSVFKTALGSPKGTRLFSQDRMKKVGLLHSFGVKDIERIANICENFNRKYIVITDSDNPAKEKKRTFKGYGEWICYNEIEGIEAITTEDFINNNMINSAIQKVLDRESIQVEVKIPLATQKDKVKIISDLLSRNIGQNVDKNRLVKLIKDEISLLFKINDLAPIYQKVIIYLSESIKKL